MEETPQNTPESQAPTPTPEQPVFTPPVSASQIAQQSKGHKKRNILLFLLIVILLIGGAAAYVLLIFLPNKPEVVFKKAADKFSVTNSSYNITGRIDQGGPNDPDFNYTIKTNAKGESSIDILATTFLQNPEVSVQNSGNKTFVKFKNFEDTKTMAKHYSNGGPKGIQEYIANFVDKSGLYMKQGTWFEVNDYILQQPASGAATAPTSLADSATLTSIGPKETVNGVSARKYQVELSKDAFKQLVGKLGDATPGGALSAIYGSYSDKNLTAEKFALTVWVGLKDKKIVKATYDGRPFKDATLSLNLEASNENSFTTPTAPKITTALGYGIIWDQLFNAKFQTGSTPADQERIADLKGIKTALEIFFAKNGRYPDRYDVAVLGDDLLNKQMVGADFAIFRDPAGRFIGKNGSQYAYVPQSKEGTEDCDTRPQFGKKCEKYFIVTTLDNGKQYQLNSGE